MLFILQLMMLLVSSVYSQSPECPTCSQVLTQIESTCKQASSPGNEQEWNQMGNTLASCVCPIMLEQPANDCTTCLLAKDPTAKGTESFNLQARDCKKDNWQAQNDLLKAFGQKKTSSAFAQSSIIAGFFIMFLI